MTKEHDTHEAVAEQEERQGEEALLDDQRLGDVRGGGEPVQAGHARPRRSRGRAPAASSWNSSSVSISSH